MEPSHKAEFLAIGLEQKVVDNTLKNAHVTARLHEVVKLSGFANGCPKATGNLLYQIATKFSAAVVAYTEYVVKKVAEGAIATAAQLDAAIEFLKAHEADKPIDNAAFDAACGVGVVVKDEEVEAYLDELFAGHADELKEQGWNYNFNTLIHKAKERFRWADGKRLMALFNAKQEALLGPKSAGKKKKAAKGEAEKPAAAAEKFKATAPDDEFKRDKLSSLIGRDMGSSLNTPDLLRKHKEATGGVVITRFPPEPNGHLHIGHAKAMRFNFTIAAEYGGFTYLRFDDTNPEKESQEYIDSIINSVSWLGYTPKEVRYSSDYFQKLYDLAVELVRRGKAYVCHQTKEEMAYGRANKIESPYRKRSVEENLKLFEDMRKGKFEENECSLRMKIDMQNANPCMRDPVAYRIKYSSHPHAGDGWCVYPTYDYTHCICDSLENITHSLCTLEFEVRRDSYYWLLEALDIYRPYVWEYSRLNLTRSLLSKRKIDKLTKEGIVTGWSDPRLLTLNGLKRRGYTPSAINAFCEEIGVTRRGNDKCLSIQLLEHFIRKELDETAPRTFCVFDPVRVVITNVSAEFHQRIDAPLFPLRDRGTRTIYFTKEVFIDRADFSEVDQKGFWGLSPSNVVVMRYGPHVRMLDVVRRADGSVDYVLAESIPAPEKKTKGIIHWISAGHSIPAEVRLYDYLFTCEEPGALGNDWMNYVNVDSLVVKKNARVPADLKGTVPYDRYQFERLGYFCADTDTKDGKIVFNRTVSLVESKEKKELGKGK